MKKPLWIFYLLAGMLALHAALWAGALLHNGHELAWLLGHWDSSWYSRIVLKGYGGKNLAFMPLYPLCVHLLVAIEPPSRYHYAQLWGAGFSTLLFLGFAALVYRVRTAAANGSPAYGFVPESPWSWFVLLAQPASYVFHSHHTESLFLILSWGALLLASKNSWAGAGLLAGLSALTRLQGGLVILAAALVLFDQTPPTRQGRMRALGCLGLGSALAALYPIWQYLEFGSPLAFLHYQSQWHGIPTMTLKVYFRTLFLNNPWQHTDFWSISHWAFFVLMGVGAWLLYPRNRALAVYCAASAGIMPLEGFLDNAFRYCAVLFPVLFLLGDRLARLPRWSRFALAGAWVLYNVLVTLNYADKQWAY